MKLKELFTKKYMPLTISVAVAVLLIAAAILLAFLWPRSEPAINSSDILPSSDYVSSDVVSEPEPEIVEPELVITSHKSTDTTTVKPFTVFAGKSDPAFPLYMNGEEVPRDEAGNFTIEKELSIGPNEFKFSHKDKEVTYIVRYRYVVIDSFSPSGAKSYSSGSTFAVTVLARKGSTVTATFNGTTITLSPTDTAGGDEDKKQDETFINYSGSFALPDDNAKNLSLGKITFYAVCGEYSETAHSGNITCKAAVKQTVGEVVAFSAETFNGDTSDDDSRPTNNYFPKGTVDYVVGKTYYGEKEYLILRCGRRVYVDKKIVPGGGKSAVSKEYVAKLPDTNALSVASLQTDTRFTTLTLNTEWKAPFFLDILPQKYVNPARQEYSISSFTATYVDITFCYSRAFEGTVDIGDYNPVFKSAEVIQNNGNSVLRLYLRRTGGFYGWDAYYNGNGQLVFKFLHPVQVKEADNAYGADLTGVKILIDVGHGGIDPGTSDRSGTYTEKERNLALALKLQSELQSAGATVILNRTGDVSTTVDARCEKLKSVGPDLCIAIHHDANESSRPNGFGSFYSTPYSYQAAQYIYNRTINTGIYNASAQNNRNRCEWHYYNVARMSNCPVVLTENGFMSNAYDMGYIASDESLVTKATAIAKGAVDYFLGIRQYLPTPPPEAPPEEPPVSSEENTTSSEAAPPSQEEDTSSPSSSSEEVSSEEVSSPPPTSSDENSSENESEPQDPEDNKDNTSSEDTSHET